MPLEKIWGKYTLKTLPKILGVSHSHPVLMVNLHASFNLGRFLFFWLLPAFSCNINSQKPDFLFSSTKGRFWKQQKLCNEKSFDLPFVKPNFYLLNKNASKSFTSVAWSLLPFFPNVLQSKMNIECLNVTYMSTNTQWNESFLKNKESEPHDNHKYIYEVFGPRQL